MASPSILKFMTGTSLLEGSASAMITFDASYLRTISGSVNLLDEYCFSTQNHIVSRQLDYFIVKDNNNRQGDLYQFSRRTSY